MEGGTGSDCAIAGQGSGLSVTIGHQAPCLCYEKKARSLIPGL